MAKPKVQYVCSDCGENFPQWQGQCTNCGQWNTLKQFSVASAAKSASPVTRSYAGSQDNQVKTLSEIQLSEIPRISTTLGEFDRVLGGGLVPGSVVLIGGDPGIGKSSLLLQVMCHLSQEHSALYVTGEESAEQVALCADRMGLPNDKLKLLTETAVEPICEQAKAIQPKIMVVDSIQTLHMLELAGASGGVTQVRESAAYLTRFAKQTHTTLFIVGHVTKSGEVAGPRVLEHIVDAVLYLEGQNDGRYRVLRAVKNRFGAVNEIGVFAMTDQGMKEVKNPSAIFLSRGESHAPGALVMILWEGSRPLLVEVQALVDDNQYGQPRRITVGYDSQRLAMLLAVLHRHGGVQTAGQDVFINVVGGVKVTETSADLALTLAITSSLKNKTIPTDVIAFGEVGLSGEIRPVSNGLARIQEAAKHGFKTVMIPKANAPKSVPKGMRVIAVSRLQEAILAIAELS